MNFLATFLTISEFTARLGRLEKSKIHPQCGNLPLPRMKTNHGQTQGNHVPTSAGTGSPLQGNTEVARWCIQLSNFTAESGKGNRTHSLVWILIAQIYLPRVSRPSRSQRWAWQSEEEEGRNSSELKSKSDFPKEQSRGSWRCVRWGNLGADRCLAHVRAWGWTGNFVS